MKTYFLAKDLPVLRFTYEADSQGSVIPPEAFATFNKSVPVFWGPFDLEHYAGDAVLRRQGDVLLADLKLLSTWADRVKSEKMIGELYPATCFNVLAATGATIFKLHVEALTLTPHGNADYGIGSLAQYLVRVPNKSELN